jgi:hypothetical protein
MFIEEAKAPDENNVGKKLRWGDEALVYSDIKVIPQKLESSDKDITIKLKAVAKQNVQDPNFGFLIKTAAGDSILGTNSVIVNRPAKPMKAGESVELEWKVPNIFNDGIHYIDPAITYKGGNQMAEWWEKAASFRSLRENKTPYLVSPDIDLMLSEPAKPKD